MTVESRFSMNSAQATISGTSVWRDRVSRIRDPRPSGGNRGMGRSARG